MKRELCDVNLGSQRILQSVSTHIELVYDLPLLHSPFFHLPLHSADRQVISTFQDPELPPCLSHRTSSILQPQAVAVAKQKIHVVAESPKLILVLGKNDGKDVRRLTWS